VRQLENICHWLTVMAPAQVVEPKDLPPELIAAPLGADDEPTPVPPVPSPAPISDAAVALPARVGTAVPVDRSEMPGAVAPPAPVPAEVPPLSATTAVRTAVDAHAVWWQGLGHEARLHLMASSPGVWDMLTRQFESTLIRTALEVTRGRRIEAAQRLGIGRNTITRKIQELGLDD
jgi:two-component system nitrogen regulation response regulator GlnG